jgi:hypothetical protein
MEIRYANLDDAEKITKNNVLLARESEKTIIYLSRKLNIA